MSEHAVARAGDPETSWEAAQSQTSEKIRVSQQAVLRVLGDVGPCTDRYLVSAYQSAMDAGYELPQSESGIRTRRKELARYGLVVDTGRRFLLPSGRRAIVWSSKVST